MTTYTVKFNTANLHGKSYYQSDSFAEILAWLEEDVTSLGGGRADVFDENDIFVWSVFVEV